MGPRLPSRVARVAALAVPDGGGAAQLGIVAPGTCGAGAAVAAVAQRLRERDIPALRVTGRRLEADHPLGAVGELRSALAGPDGTLPPDEADDERAWRDTLVAHLEREGAALVVE